MSRTLQDQFIDDDEEETCPLCVEEFDLTDKGFRPCPCGYQICQFCYHNVKTNLNGLCPACRRPYNDADIEYKVITPEETAAHKSRQAQRQKKTQAAIQKEKQKAEADHLSRKHLAGLRVVQKNLVYVTGLNPTSQEDQLLQTLRGDQYFGQYGKIIKIVVSKAKDPSHPHSVGVYVTYERKEDAASCINAVNGSKNGERTLRAQFGTTKYCSAYLRNETCQNRNCMFLHEPGEANESYSRADLSALNAGSTQGGESRPPPPQSQQPVASAAQPMVRQPSVDQPQSPAVTDRPALPSTASWASRPVQAQPSRAESRSTSGAKEVAAARETTPAPTPAPFANIELKAQQDDPPAKEDEPIVPTPPQATAPRKSPVSSPLLDLLKNFSISDFKFVFSATTLPPGDLEIIKSYPPLFDHNGGEKRKLRREREEVQKQLEQEAQVNDLEDNPEMSGSLQLGGEPEDSQSTTANRPLGEGGLDQRFQFGASSPTAADRGLTPQQHQQLLLQTMKSSNDSGSYLGQPGGAFQQQNASASSSNPPGHQRNVSRFSFANDTASASANVKPVANPKLLNQQSAMMPPSTSFGSQQPASNGQQFFTSNVQGPPPGLKTTGTPPVSGGMTFGQGHGFATGGLQYGSNAVGRNANEEMMRSLLRGRDGAGSVDVAKQQRDADFPPLATPSRQASLSLDGGAAASRHSTPPVPPGFEAQVANESRRSTPVVPPGLSKPSALPNLDDDTPGSRPGSRPSSRASLRRQASLQQIVPAIPLIRPGTPGTRPATPSRGLSEYRVDDTPTKPSKKPAAPGSTLAVQESVVEEDKAAPTQPAKIADNATTAGADAPTSVETEKQNSVAAIKPEPATDAAPTRARKASAAAQTAAKSTAASSSKTAATTPIKFEDIAPKEDSQKRKHPGKLDITAAVKQQEIAVPSLANPVDAATPIKQAQRSVSQTPSVLSKPESPALPSPAVKTAPRTLRLTQTPKVETPPAQPFPIPSGVSNTSAAAGRMPSRQPSVASINLPGTPSSEQISMSDNISLASTSQSRANSPPPPGAGKVGSAPVRMKTKSQMKKERQERAKIIEQEQSRGDEPAGVAGVDEPAQEAIVSRKKKSKKEKEVKIKDRVASTTADTTPTASRPASPPPKPVAEAPPPEKITPLAVSPAKPSTPKSVPAQKTPPMVPAQEPSPPPTPTLTAAALLAELKASAPEIQKCIDSLFRTPNTTHFKTDQKISPKDFSNPALLKQDFKLNLTKDEVDALLRGTMPALHYGGANGRVWDRGMVTPTGAHLRALSEELESRFLDLEKALRAMPEELRFHPSKPQNETKFPGIDLEALKRQFDQASHRAVSAMEQMVQDGSTMKKGAFLVDEASKYINEFVMPPATPPPSTGVAGNKGYGGAQPNIPQQQQQQAAAGAAMSLEMLAPSVEIAERGWSEAKRVADEKESALKKVIKKNKKLLGLG